MRRVLLALSILAAMMPLTVRPAWACSCAPPGDEQDAKESAARAADAVFTGRVRRLDPGPRWLVAHFRVRLVYKGHVRERESVWTVAQESACGYPFRDGVRYTVFGEEDRDGDLHVGLCGATKRGAIDPNGYDLPKGRAP